MNQLLDPGPSTFWNQFWKSLPSSFSPPPGLIQFWRLQYSLTSASTASSLSSAIIDFYRLVERTTMRLFSFLFQWVVIFGVYCCSMHAIDLAFAVLVWSVFSRALFSFLIHEPDWMTVSFKSALVASIIPWLALCFCPFVASEYYWHGISNYLWMIPVVFHILIPECA